ncbi:FAD-dependent oxidoreductase [Corticibacterium sp. UT-5YL-CI-8]|nr:FAD-dependent oxidoreductase [Tianweitania sp. UT-5YL-CI-8]
MNDGVCDFDVIVLGGGAAGLCAAISARQAGARVLIAEAAPRLGGSTALSGGNILAGGTHIQEKAGIVDTAQALFDYLTAINQNMPRPGVVRRYCFEAPDTLAWLETLGVNFPAEELRRIGASGPPRAHRAEGHGAGLVSVLEREVFARGVEVATNTRVDGLLLDADEKRIRGIRAAGCDVTAPAVVIAMGGFGASNDRLDAYYAAARRHPDCAWYIGVATAQGDGLDMVAEVGADNWGHDEGLLLLTSGFSRDIELYPPGWLVLVNEKGARFVDETADYAIQSFAVQRQPGGACHAIFDQASLELTAKPVQDFRTSYASPNWHKDRLQQLLADGRILRAETLVELATQLGTDASRLAATVDRYNRLCERGIDTDFGKDAAWMRALSQPPFYAVKLMPAVISMTGMGPVIDDEAAVLSEGLPVPGLFAAGEVTGGLGGFVYAGSGASVGNGVVFGRIAGASAARHALTMSDGKPKPVLNRGHGRSG